MQFLNRLHIRFLAFLCLSILMGSFLTHCASYKLDDSDPKALNDAAERDFKSDRYQLATEKFRAIRNKFPYSNYAVLAQLRLADVYFAQESFLEAAVAYETFCDLHPNHEKSSYAKYRIAESYLKDSPDNIARDQSSAKKAEDAFQAFLEKYPNAPEMKEVQEGLRIARLKLAKKEYYVGEHYRKWDYFESARTRYKGVIDHYADTEIAKDAAERLAQIEGKTNPPPPEQER